MNLTFPSDFDESPKPVLIQDTREQLPLKFSRLACEVGTLATADYSIRGLETHFGIERKSIPDLVACCVGENRQRFEAELVRLRGYSFRRLLIVGSPSEIQEHRYRSNISPNSVFASLHAWQARYAIPFTFIPSPEEAAAQVECWAAWTFREARKQAEGISA